MASLGMYPLRPYPLTAKEVARVVQFTGPGNYALGYARGIPRKLRVQYVGRSDADLKARLLQHAAAGEYSYFKFSQAPSPKVAFERECHNYHDFMKAGLDNDMHPQRPAGMGWQCPRCDAFQVAS